MTVSARKARPEAMAERPASRAAPEAGRTRRPDPRAAKTIENIVNAAQNVMMNHGTPRITAQEVCDAAGVSRGTLYRYFPSMEAVLEAVVLRLRTETDDELNHAMEGCETPTERFAAFLKYSVSNNETRRGSQFLHVEPAFVIQYFESNFDHFIARVLNALDPVFDAWERDIGTPVDRNAIAEMMVRLALSETVVPPAEGKPLALRLQTTIDLILRTLKRG
ncbi:TetR/AcrR family transcriptional regulator [Brevundimonas sp.]|uniref:TetR/AcrR family transcriptional regulator n=1 Tax=Brevundimonas sp. TaxID=1871086 RepID=UPI001A1B0FAE|nr:TetR/AcrR family transcriptional regulator [Brevundimonas sp.]MBJ7483297.1 TetR/AcrR family transcriptional regulator [Brevundimonas sp.]